MTTEGDKPDDRRDRDPSWDALATVWWSVVAMLGICIPLVAVTRIPMLPLFVLGAGVAATVVVLAGRKGRREGDDVASAAERERLETRIRELEERLANVEVIESFEDRLADKELEQRRREEADRQSPAPVEKPGRLGTTVDSGKDGAAGNDGDAGRPGDTVSA